MTPEELRKKSGIEVSYNIWSFGTDSDELVGLGKRKCPDQKIELFTDMKIPTKKTLAISAILCACLLIACIYLADLNRDYRKGFDINNIVGVYQCNYDEYAQYITVYDDLHIIVTDTDGNQSSGTINASTAPNIYIISAEKSRNVGDAQFVSFHEKSLFLMTADKSVSEYIKIDDEPVVVIGK